METVHFLQSFASPALDSFFLWITNLGSDRAYIVFLVATYLAVDAKIGQRAGVFVLLGFYLNFQLKGLVDTPRPYVLEPAVGRSAEALATGTGPGFPSSHAQNSLIFWGYLAASLRRPWLWVVAAALVVLLSLSRLYLGLHLPIDVLGGLVIGALLLALFVYGEPLWSRLGALPTWLKLALGLAVPFLLVIFLPPPGLEPDLILGGLAAFLTAPLLVSHRAEGPLWKRITLAVLGVVLVFAALFASSLLLPDAIKREPAFGFFRYLLIGYAGLVLAPWLGRILSLAPQARL
jgi:membrane-associated phospholipid phosphatase